MLFIIPCVASIDFLRMINILYCANMSSFFFLFLPFVTFLCRWCLTMMVWFIIFLSLFYKWGFFDLVLTFCNCVLFKVVCVIFLVVLLVTCANKFEILYWGLFVFSVHCQLLLKSFFRHFFSYLNQGYEALVNDLDYTLGFVTFSRFWKGGR